MNETETVYVAEYQTSRGGDDWYIAGDIYGYEDRADAAKALEDKRRKSSTGLLGVVTAGRIVTRTTTTQVHPYLFV